MKLFLHKTNGGLWPVHDEDLDKYLKLNNNKIYSCELKHVRNVKHHRLIFALARTTLENLSESNKWGQLYIQDPHGMPYKFLKAILMEIGEFDINMKVDGEIYYTPKSLAFSEMSEDEFSPISESIFKVCANVLNIEVEELKKNYISYL